jgi:hypothetical protein
MFWSFKFESTENVLGAMTETIMTLNLMPPSTMIVSITSLGIMALIIKTVRIMAFSITI